MTPRSNTQNEKVQEMTVTEQLGTSETALKFGFKFVTDDQVPPPPRKRDADPERWSAVQAVLKSDPRAHGQWAMIKEFDKAGSAQAKASRINGDNEKLFPVAEGWEARSVTTVEKTDTEPGKSELYVRYNPKVKSEK
jgi:hypothetical protein